jgi:hypothetical protein
MEKPVATGLFVGIDGVINQRLEVKNFRTRTAALELSARKPLLFDGQEFIQSLFAQLERNWTAVLSPSTKPPSRGFSIADHWLFERNLAIWNDAIYCTLVVRDILMVSPR